MIQLDYSNHRPLYEQIKDKLKELILNAALKENDKMPSVRELAGILAINPNTIQKAYNSLEAEGYIYSIRAKGSFVAPKSNVINKSGNEEITAEFESVVRQMKFMGMGYDQINKLLKKEFNL